MKRTWSDAGNSNIASKVEECASTLSGWANVTFRNVNKIIKKKEEELEMWLNKIFDGAMIDK